MRKSNEDNYNWVAYGYWKRFGLGLLYDSDMGSEGLGYYGRECVSDLDSRLSAHNSFPFNFSGQWVHHLSS
jgi:hypothetical protein